MKIHIHRWLIISFICLTSACATEQEQAENLSPDSFKTVALQSGFEFSESDEIAFSSINDVKFDAHGNILVKDFRLRYIARFDQQGNLLQKIGQKGRGPGDFLSIGSFITENTTLMVTDVFLPKIEVFDYRDSAYVYSHAISFKNEEGSGSLLAATEKGIILSQGEPIFATQQHFSPIRMNSISLVSRDGKMIKDTIATYPVRESLITETGEFLSMTKAFGNKGYAVYSGNNVYTVWSDSLDINYVTPDGQKHHAFSFKLSPVEITALEKDSVLSNKREPQKSELEKQFPAVKPLIEGILIDDEQRIWLEVNANDIGNHWFAFSKDGEPLLRIKKPHPSAELRDVYKNKVLWNYTTTEGAPTITMAKMVN